MPPFRYRMDEFRKISNAGSADCPDLSLEIRGLGTGIAIATALRASESPRTPALNRRRGNHAEMDQNSWALAPEELAAGDEVGNRCLVAIHRVCLMGPGMPYQGSRFLRVESPGNVEPMGEVDDGSTACRAAHASVFQRA